MAVSSLLNCSSLKEKNFNFVDLRTGLFGNFFVESRDSRDSSQREKESGFFSTGEGIGGVGSEMPLPPVVMQALGNASH